MNDHNLDDLIIDNIEPKNSKTKSFLTIVALLIIVLIVAIILTKIILKDPNEGNISVDDNIEMISPELTLQNITKKKEVEVKEKTKLSSIIEKELNKPVKAPKNKEVIKVRQPVKAEKEKLNIPKTEVSQIEKPKIKKPKLETIQIKKPKPETETGSVKITKEFDQSHTEKKHKTAITPKVKPTPAKKTKVETITSASKPIYYIQVGSFSQQPSKRLLSAVKNNGFKYRIKNAGKMKKVQIGPFVNRAAADTALVRIRDRIKKDSFVVKK
jgi:DedD protein